MTLYVNKQGDAYIGNRFIYFNLYKSTKFLFWWNISSNIKYKKNKTITGGNRMIDYLHNTTVNMEEDLKEISKRIDAIMDRFERTGNAQFAVIELKILCEELDLR